jgi:hypothetical protein
MIASHLRPGFTELEAASTWAPSSEEWIPFMRDVLNMPLSMLPAVHYAMGCKAWKVAKDPIKQVRGFAQNWEKRRARSACGDDYSFKPAVPKGEPVAMNLRTRFTARLELLRESLQDRDIETAEVEAGRLVVDLTAASRNHSIAPHDNDYYLEILLHAKRALSDVNDGKFHAGLRHVQSALDVCAAEQHAAPKGG